MHDVVMPKKYKLEDFHDFIQSKCEILQLNNCSIIMIDQDHTDDRALNPFIESIGSAKNTKAILVEYFRPELLKNAQSFPILGKLLEKLFDSQIGVTYRTNISDKLADIAKLTNKVIAVSDIACNPQYFYAYGGLSTSLVIANSFIPELLPLTLAYSTMWGVNRVQEFITHSGHFDINQIHQYEQILLDAEDARRVYTATGLQKLTQQYHSSVPNENRILMCFPKEHRMRITNYLMNSMQRSNKRQIYRFLPLIKKTLRQYDWNTSYIDFSENKDLGKWKLFSEESL
jgi:hypothetical protein